MSNVLKIKRSNVAHLVPTSLAEGELSVNLADKRLYAGDGSTVFQVGGPQSNVVIGANSTFNGIDHGYGRRTTAGLTTQTLDSWPIASWRAANYQVSIKDNVANNFHTAQLSMLFNGGDCMLVPYAVMYSNTYLGSFTATANATHGILQFTPTSANTTLTFSRTLLSA